jgi:hypothetical protein
MSMKLNNVKKLVELLIIKRNAAVIRTDEIVLLDELQYLLAIDNKMFPVSNAMECTCELDESTIEIEIEENKCSVCGLPRCVSE